MFLRSLSYLRREEYLLKPSLFCQARPFITEFFCMLGTIFQSKNQFLKSDVYILTKYKFYNLLGDNTPKQVEEGIAKFFGAENCPFKPPSTPAFSPAVLGRPPLAGCGLTKPAPGRGLKIFDFPQPWSFAIPSEELTFSLRERSCSLIDRKGLYINSIQLSLRLSTHRPLTLWKNQFFNLFRYVQKKNYFQGNKLENKSYHNKSNIPVIEFRQLNEIDKEEIMELMNLPSVRSEMPLAKGPFDDEAYRSFMSEKEQLWVEHGYGPWAFTMNGKFIGWGGLQFEAGDADLGLVLHPDYWGIGKYIYRQIIQVAFDEMGLDSITILLPPSRNCNRTLLRWHFKPDGKLKINDEWFLRFRLHAADIPK